ncbi:MAG: ABC transporter ATP-binding protein [Planctomycetota bacterium]|nr:ABC transporter ATP-binding protein [Planctomycetota bacterium]
MPYLSKYKGSVVAVIVLGAIAALGSRFTIVFIKPLIDRLHLEPGDAPVVDPSESSSLLNDFTSKVLEPWLATIGDWGLNPGVSQALAIVLVMLSLAIMFAVVQYVFIKVSRMLSVYMVTDLRQDMASHVAELGMGYHSGRRLGDLVSRMTTDATTALRILNMMIEEMVQSPFSIAGSLLVAYAAEPTATIGTLLFLPVLALPVIKIGPRIRSRARKSQDSLGDTTQLLTQMLSGIRVVKSFRMEKRESEEYQRANQSFVRDTRGMVRAQAVSLAVTAFFANGGVGLVIGALVIVHLTIVEIFQDVGTMFAFFIAIGTLFAYVRRLTRAVTGIYATMGSLDRVFEVFDLEPDIKPNPNALELKHISDKISFEGVEFSYPDAPEKAIDGLDLQVARGERVALVGSSGAGKSTLLDLVARFYDVDAGAIKVDGIDLRDINQDDWLAQLAVVQQRPFLFQSSIKENILYGKLDATDAELNAAIDAANLRATIDQLPDGLETQVGDSGSRLSGGQAQRVTIARAILKDAEVLLLDEATSALDSESEHKVQVALENLMAGRTSFVIAHRLGTIKSADRILVLEDGKIVEQGSHQQLIAVNGAYSRMWNLQLGVEQ